MNKEEPYRDQAERLKRRIEKINEQTVESDLLPPRDQVHRQKKKKTNFKLKYPVIRLLVLFFILLPIIYFSVISYLDGKKMNRSEKTTSNSVGYETINLEKQKEDNSTKIEEKKKPKQDNSNRKETTNNVEEQSNKKEQPAQTESTELNTNTDNSSNNQNSNSNGNVQTNSTFQPAVASTKIIYHTVNPQETLFRIAMKYYDSKDGVDIIKQANHLKSEHITVGQVLKIPIKN